LQRLREILIRGGLVEHVDVIGHHHESQGSPRLHAADVFDHELTLFRFER